MPELPDEKEIKLTFSFPDVITVGHYEIYNSARLKFIEGQDNPSNLRAQYEGGIALLKAGVVHLTFAGVGLQDGEIDSAVIAFGDKVKAIVFADDQSATPINLMALIATTVSSKMETELIRPTIFGVTCSINVTPSSTQRLKS